MCLKLDLGFDLGICKVFQTYLVTTYCSSNVEQYGFLL